jgi:hypothetical protein
VQIIGSNSRKDIKSMCWVMNARAQTQHGSHSNSANSELLFDDDTMTNFVEKVKVDCYNTLS